MWCADVCGCVCVIYCFFFFCSQFCCSDCLWDRIENGRIEFYAYCGKRIWIRQCCSDTDWLRFMKYVWIHRWCQRRRRRDRRTNMRCDEFSKKRNRSVTQEFTYRIIGYVEIMHRLPFDCIAVGNGCGMRCCSSYFQHERQLQQPHRFPFIRWIIYRFARKKTKRMQQEVLVCSSVSNGIIRIIKS